MPQKPGLNRNLSAERMARKAQTQQARLVPQGLPTARPDQLMASPENGRKKLLKIAELAESLRSDGMNTAMTVIPPDVYIKAYPQHREAVEAGVAAGVLFVVHHGHRRLAAAIQAPLDAVPILVRHDVPSLRIAAIQENLQRMGLNPIEEGVEFQEALAEKDDDGKSLSQRELAKRAGCSQTYVSHRVALLRLVPDLRQAVIRHWMKEQQLPDAESGSDDEATSALLLPVREAATVYARLRTDLQEAFIRGELTAMDAAVVSKLPVDQQALPSGEAEADCPAINTEDAPKAALPVPRGSEVPIPESPAADGQPGTVSATGRQDAPKPAGRDTAQESSSQTDTTAKATTAVAEQVEPRGVLVVRGVEELASGIQELLSPTEVEDLKRLLSS
ncbi:ParB/RepB/Spo0J family partition protein [Streptomyces mirabilis]|uniref:ParB/RepB/Spo0J family partition protein n=1 Tax=Streptomyces mirabilis TaxID=68239 RepID=UPI0033E8CC0B